MLLGRAMHASQSRVVVGLATPSPTASQEMTQGRSGPGPLTRLARLARARREIVSRRKVGIRILRMEGMFEFVVVNL
jgi:hypothetical protein